MVDGVSRCTLGYAKALHEGGYGSCIVVTPRFPKEKREYSFPVYNFSSAKLSYGEFRAGFPFMPKLISKIKSMNVDLLHVHSPFISMVIARQLRYLLDVPIIYTQHTKWEYDIERVVYSKTLQKKLENFVYNNISTADEVWAVSDSTGKHLVSRGYEGSYLVMPNGTDFTKEKADPALLSQINNRFDIPAGVPVLLFVGRMMWYKNINLIIEALEILHAGSFDYRMIFVGDGEDLPEIKKMVEKKKLAHIIHFAGKIDSREELRAFYTCSDLLMFPSVYDNAPLVIREAAACFCPSLVVGNSSASEILEDGVTGFFAEENSEDIANKCRVILSNHTILKTVAENASEQVYLTWNQVIEKSIERYKEVKEIYDRESMESTKKRKII